MNNRQEDRVSMFLKVRQYLSDNVAMVSSVVPFIQTIQNDFNAKLDNILQLQSSAMAQLSGYTEIKQTIRTKLTACMFKVTRASLLYAEVNEQPDLKEKVRYTHSELTKKRDTELFALSVLLFDLCAPLQNQLSMYGVSSQDVLDLKQFSGEYIQVIQLPKEKIGERSSINQSIDEEITAVSEMLSNKLDIAMQIVEMTYPQLNNQYKSARNVENTTGASSSSEEITVTAIPNGFTTIKNLKYNGDTTFICKNVGAAPLSIGLGLTETAFVGTYIILSPNDELTREAADFSSEGDYLIVFNDTAAIGNCKVKIS